MLAVAVASSALAVSSAREVAAVKAYAHRTNPGHEITLALCNGATYARTPTCVVYFATGAHRCRPYLVRAVGSRFVVRAAATACNLPPPPLRKKR